MNIIAVWGLVVMVLALCAVALLLGALVFALSRSGAWLEMRAANVPVSFVDLLMIKLKGLDQSMVLACMKSLWKAGQHIGIETLEGHVQAGGHLPQVVQAIIAADKAGINVNFAQMAAMDLAGRDVLEAVRSNVEPKVLVCPPPSLEYKDSGIVGVTRDGVAMGVKARITVRTRLDRLVGGAGEATILARVGEGIVSALGKAASHQEILMHPDLIVQAILDKGLDAGTCFEILSVDVADIDVLDNVNARLKVQQAETDKRIAQAKAARAHADAVARQQEMKAANLENAARVVAAKAELPMALTRALHSQSMGRRTPMPAPFPEKVAFWRKGIQAFSE